MPVVITQLSNTAAMEISAMMFFDDFLMSKNKMAVIV